jgi:hypothetical protein
MRVAFLAIWQGSVNASVYLFRQQAHLYLLKLGMEANGGFVTVGDLVYLQSTLYQPAPAIWAILRPREYLVKNISTRPG